MYIYYVVSAYDVDGNDSLDMSELVSLMRATGQSPDAAARIADRFMKLADENDDGVLSFKG